MASLKELVIRGVMLTWLARACAFVITFVVTPIMLQGLGGPAYGLWSMIMSFAAYYGLGDMGLQIATVKYVAEFHAKNERDRIIRFLLTLTIIYVAVSLLVLLAATAVSATFPYFVEVPPELLPSLRIAVVLTGASVAVRLITQVSLGALKGLKRYDLISGIGVLSQLAQAAGIVIVVKTGYGFTGMGIVTVSVSICSLIATAAMARRQLGPIAISLKAFDRSSLRLMMHFGSHTVIRGVAMRMSRSAGPLLVGAIVSPVSAAIFSVADALVSKTQTLFKAVSGISIPVASELNAGQQTGRIQRLIVEVPRFLLVISTFAATVFIVFGHDLIDLWTGMPGFADKGYPIICVLSASFVVSTFGAGLSSILTGCGKLRFLTVVSIINAVARIGISAVLLVVLRDGIGMAWGILIPTAVAGGIAIPFYSCSLFDLSYWRFLRRVSIGPLLGSLPSIAIALTLKYGHKATSLWELCLQVGVVGTFAAAGAFFISFDQSTRQDIMQTMRLRRSKAQQSKNRQH